MLFIVLLGFLNFFLILRLCLNCFIMLTYLQITDYSGFSRLIYTL